MKTVDYSVVQQDLLTNDKYLAVYLDLKANIMKYRNSPGCGPCKNVINTVLQRGPKPLEAVYGEPVEIKDVKPSSPPASPGTPPPPQFRRQLVFEKIPIDQYEETLKRIAGYGPQIPSSFYVADEKMVYVTYIRTLPVNTNEAKDQAKHP